MLREIEVNGTKFFLSPESNFWAIGDREEVEEFYRERREELLEDMQMYRFEIDVKTAYINPTERCNRNCPYCYIPAEIRSRGAEMSYERLEEVLTVLAENGVERVIFHGAEPLLARDTIFKAMEHFDFNYGIQTNATLLEKEDAEFLIEKRASVGISFDSPYRKTNDYLRGKGQYDAVLRALDYFEDYGNLNVITTVNRYNYQHLPAMVDFLAGKVGVMLANPVRGTSEGGRALRPPGGFEEYYMEAVDRAIENTKNGKRIVIGDFANVLLGLVAPTSRVLQCDISPCGGGRRFIAVCVDGVYPCGEFIGMSEFRAGLSAIFDWEGLMEKFEKVRRRTVELIEECRDCEFRNLCGAPCPAEVYAESGSMFRKSPYCEFYKRLSVKAMEVIARGEVGSVLRLERMKKVYEAP